MPLVIELYPKCHKYFNMNTKMTNYELDSSCRLHHGYFNVVKKISVSKMSEKLTKFLLIDTGKVDVKKLVHVFYFHAT